MSLQAIELVLQSSQAKGTALAVMLILAHRTNDQYGCAWPSATTLARECNTSERNIHKIISKLEDDGELRCENKGPSGQKTLYFITLSPKNTERTDSSPDANTEPQFSNGAQKGEPQFSNGCTTVQLKANHSSAKVNHSSPELKGTESELKVNDPKPEKSKSKSKSTPTQQASREMFQALTDLCKIDLDLITDKSRGQFNQAEKKMRENGYSPDDVRAFESWWYANDWRGQKGQPPTLQNVRSEWRKFLEWQRQPKSQKAENRYAAWYDSAELAAAEILREQARDGPD